MPDNTPGPQKAKPPERTKFAMPGRGNAKNAKALLKQARALEKGAGEKHTQETSETPSFKIRVLKGGESMLGWVGTGLGFIPYVGSILALGPRLARLVVEYILRKPLELITRRALKVEEQDKRKEAADIRKELGAKPAKENPHKQSFGPPFPLNLLIPSGESLSGALQKNPKLQFILRIFGWAALGAGLVIIGGLGIAIFCHQSFLTRLLLEYKTGISVSCPSGA